MTSKVPFSVVSSKRPMMRLSAHDGDAHHDRVRGCGSRPDGCAYDCAPRSGSLVSYRAGAYVDDEGRHENGDAHVQPLHEYGCEYVWP